MTEENDVIDSSHLNNENDPPKGGGKSKFRLPAWIGGKRGRDALHAAAAVAATREPPLLEAARVPTRELPRAGIFSDEIPETPEKPATPFLVVGLTDMEDFSLEEFFAKTDAVQPPPEDTSLNNAVKYIVIRQENEEQPPTDALVVFPENVKHDSFLNRLRAIGYSGKAQSAGLILLTSGDVPSIALHGASDTLYDTGDLSVSKSYDYQKNTLAKKLSADVI
ncbi:MAG: hypothetical protein ACREHC_01055 [Candidatus Levyibacteriota bacterium]